MNVVVKYHDIRKIEENSNGTVTLTYLDTLAYKKAIEKAKGQVMDIPRVMFPEDFYVTITVEKGQLVNYYA
jgi:hypothetical protein